MQTQESLSREALPLDEAIKVFSRRPYWQTFQDNVVGDISVHRSQEGVTCAVATYREDPTIELRLENSFLFEGSNLPFETRTGMRIIRKGTSKNGVVTHGMARSPKTYEEVLFSSMLEEPKKSTWRCGFDLSLRKVTDKLYRQFEAKFYERRN